MLRILSAVAALAVVAAGPVAANAVAPTHTPLLPAGSHAAYYDPLTAMAGSAHYLAYATSNSQPGGGADVNTSVLWIRKADGTTYELSPTAHVPEPYGVSMAGSILVVGGPGQLQGWYDLANHTHGTPVPAPASTNGRVMGASKDGWFTASNHQPGGNEIFDTTTSGTVTSDGVPFPESTTDLPIFQVLAGPAGVIADDGPDIAYMKYSTPGVWTTLTAISHDDVSCTDLSATDAACVKYVVPPDDEDTSVPKDILQVPLDGSPVVTTTPDCAGAAPQLSATAIVWQCGSHVDSVPLGGGTVSESSVTVPAGTQLESAQGTVDFSLNPTDAPATMYAVTAADQALDPLFVTSHSSVEASQLAVTSGRIAWQDDRDRLLPVSIRRVTRSTNGQLKLGAESHPFTAANRDGLAVSGARTAVDTNGPGVSESSPLGESRVPPTGPLSQAYVNEQPLSGNRYLFARSHHARFYEFVVRDLGSQSNRVITSPDKAPIQSAALWGDEVAFVDLRGGVWSHNLATGNVRRLKAPLSKHSKVEALVSVYDREVGWDTLQFRHGEGHVNSRYRNVHTMAPATKLPANDVITQASSDGFVIRHFIHPSRIDIFGGGYPDPTATWELQPYGGRPRQLLTDAPGAAQVTVDNGVAVYLDAHQQPQAVAVAHPAASAPVSLGDPIAPKRFADKKHNHWTTYQAFSRPLTSCAIAIRRSGSLVARLRCDRGAMTTGDAYARWDGRDTSGKRVHAGNYRWRIHAKSAKGKVRSPGSRALHGVLALSR